MTELNRLEKPSISRKELNIPLLTATAIIFMIAATVCISSLIELVGVDGARSFFRDMEEGGVRQIDAMVTWFAVSITTRLLYAVFCFVHAVGLMMTVIGAARSKDGRIGTEGLKLIGKTTHAVKYVWLGVCAILAVIFITRFVPYFISNIDNHTGIMVLVALVASEGACLALFFGVCYALMRCWSELEDSISCASYMLALGQICDLPPTSYGFCYVICGISVLCAVISIGDIIALCAFIASAAASLLLGIWYKKLKSQVEWIKYQEEKKRKQKI